MREAKNYIPGLGRQFKIARDEVDFVTLSKEEYDALMARIEALEEGAGAPE